VFPRLFHVPVANQISQCFAVECHVPKAGTALVNETAAEYSCLDELIYAVLRLSTHASVCTSSGHVLMGRLVLAETSTERAYPGVCRMECETLVVPQLTCAAAGRGAARRPASASAGTAIRVTAVMGIPPTGSGAIPATATE
jgi:hypothetical protein